MEFGAAYLRPARDSDDDGISMLSAHRESVQRQHEADHDRRASNTYLPRRSWNVSPVLPSGFQPLAQPSRRVSTQTTASLIAPPRAVMDFNYSEPVAWANSTNFGPSRHEPSKSEAQSLASAITDTSQPNDSRRYFRHPRHISEPWKAGCLDRFPWSGFAALFTILLLTGTSAGILLGSNGSTPKEWRVGSDNAQPHVYISVFEMIMNILLIFALLEGMVIRYWRQMLHGSTLSALHDTYESILPWSALKRIGRFQFNVVAVASVLVLTSMVRGPLFQRALTTVEENVDGSTELVSLSIAPYPLPEYFQTQRAAGSDSPVQVGLTNEFSRTLQNVIAGSPMQIDQPSGCGQQCIGRVKGFSFSAECQSSTRSLDLASLLEECRNCSTLQCTEDCAQRREALSPIIFSINHTTSEATSRAQDRTLNITSIFKEHDSCEGDVQRRTCSLTQVMGEYTVTFTDGVLQYTEPTFTASDDDIPLDGALMIKYWPLAMEAMFPPLSVNMRPTEDFTQLEIQKCVAPRGSATRKGAQPSCADGTELQSTLLVNDPSLGFAISSKSTNDEDPVCQLAWRNPLPDIISQMQSLAFRITMDMARADDSLFSPTYTGSDLQELRESWNKAIPMTTSRSRTVYQTSPVLVALGIFLSIVGVIAVIPLYYGFWELGRKVSLNPLEIARAFGAPLFQGLDGNVTADIITVERGGMPVKYGAVQKHNEERKLRVEETSKVTVREPWQGEIFG